MIPFVLCLLVILSSAVVTVFYKSFTKLNPDGAGLYFMLFCMSAPLAVISAVMCASAGFEITPSTVLTGVSAGALNIITIVFLLKSMAGGSFTVAVIIINLNFCIPIVLSVIFLRERASVWQLTGILLLAAVVILTNVPFKRKKSAAAASALLPDSGETADNTAEINGNASAEISGGTCGNVPPETGEKCGGGSAAKESCKQSERRKSIMFLCFALLACLGNGLVNFLIKLQQYYTPGSGENTFYLFTYASAAALSIAFYGVIRLVKRRTRAAAHEKKAFLLGLGVGACTALSQYPQSFMPKYMSAAVQFTVVAAGALLLSVLIGFIKYKEKPTVRNITSAAATVLAIFLQVIP